MNWPNSPLVGSAIIWLGKVSYSAYFVHFVVLHFLPAAHLTAWAIADVAAMYAVVIIITVGIASVTFTLIEKPMIRFGGALIVARRATASAQRTVQR